MVAVIVVAKCFLRNYHWLKVFNLNTICLFKRRNKPLYEIIPSIESLGIFTHRFILFRQIVKLTGLIEQRLNCQKYSTFFVKFIKIREIPTKQRNASRLCVSSLRRGHANLLCIVPIFFICTLERGTLHTLPVVVYVRSNLKSNIYYWWLVIVVQLNVSFEITIG